MDWTRDNPKYVNVEAARLDRRGALLLDSSRLFDGVREVLIEHAGETYRLRITRNGKLILNK